MTCREPVGTAGAERGRAPIRRCGGRGPRGRRARPARRRRGSDQHGDRLVVGAQHGRGRCVRCGSRGRRCGSPRAATARAPSWSRARSGCDRPARTAHEAARSVVVVGSSGGAAAAAVAVTSCGGPSSAPSPNCSLDGVPDGVEVDAERAQRRGVVLAERGRRGRGRGTPRHSATASVGDSVGGEQVAGPAALLGEREEEVDRAHLVGAEAVAEVLGRDDDGAGVSREAFEHGSTSGRACGGRSAW